MNRMRLKNVSYHTIDELIGGSVIVTSRTDYTSEEVVEAVRSALGRMPLRYADVFYLYHRYQRTVPKRFEGNIQKIATCYHMSVEEAQTILDQSIKWFKSELARLVPA